MRNHTLEPESSGNHPMTVGREEGVVASCSRSPTSVLHKNQPYALCASPDAHSRKIWLLPSHGYCARRHASNFLSKYQDDTFDDSSIFSVGSIGSATTRHEGRLPSSPSTIGVVDQSDDDEEDDEDLRGRWGNHGVVIGGQKHADSKQGHSVSAVHESLLRPF